MSEWRPIDGNVPRKEFGQTLDEAATLPGGEDR